MSYSVRVARQTLCELPEHWQTISHQMAVKPTLIHTLKVWNDTFHDRCFAKVYSFYFRGLVGIKRFFTCFHGQNYTEQNQRWTRTHSNSFNRFIRFSRVSESGFSGGSNVYSERQDSPTFPVLYLFHVPRQLVHGLPPAQKGSCTVSGLPSRSRRTPT